MKKLLILIVLIIMSVSLGACNSSNDYDELQEEINGLQEQLDNLGTYDDSDVYSELEAFEIALMALEERINNLVVTTGLNSVTDIYENMSNTISTMSTTITELKDTFDETKAPGYTLDENGNYIDFDELMSRLKLKYFGIDVNEDDDFYIGVITNIIIFDRTSNLNINEIFARTALMLEELSQYSQYILSSGEYIAHYYLFIDSVDYQIKITVTSTTMLADYFIVTPNGMYNEDYEMRLWYSDNVVLDIVEIQAYYDSYVTNLTFDGYVLNYIK